MMSPMETKILNALRKNRAFGMALQDLCDAAGWYEPGGLPMTPNTLQVHISNIRAKGVGIEKITVYRLVG